LRELLGQIEGFIVDLDGTTYLGGRIIPGADRFFAKLQEFGRKWIFVSNNSSKDARFYSDKLTRMGIPTSPENVMTSGMATIAYLRELNEGRRIFLLGTPSLENEFTSAGFELTDDKPDFVVLGFDKTLTYQKLETACRLIDSGVPLIATHPDKVCPTETGYIPDAGSMIALLESATGVSPAAVVGKPGVRMVSAALDAIRASREHAAMIGDRIYTDMRMGRDAGLTTILVLSGESTADDARESKELIDIVVNSLGELADLM
jgi:HAD superfamily hydrolase (TIGR01457 family)